MAGKIISCLTTTNGCGTGQDVHAANLDTEFFIGDNTKLFESVGYGIRDITCGVRT